MIAVDEELPWGWGGVYQRGGEEGSRQKKRLREGAWFAEQQVLRLTSWNGEWLWGATPCS